MNNTTPLATSWSPQELEKVLGQVREVVAVVGPAPASTRPLTKALKKWAASAVWATATVVAGSAAEPALLSMTAALSGVASTVVSTDAEAGVRSTHEAFRALYPGQSWETAPVVIDPVQTLSPAEQHWQSILKDAPVSWEEFPKYLHGQQEPFLALASVLEHYVPQPYVDPGGLNVGYGYCITRRIQDWGEERVRDDLTSAGFSSSNVDLLIKGGRAAKEIKVEPLQALRLLWLTQSDYQEIARNTLGGEVFDGLSSHRQATLTWLAYNTGESGFAQFKRLATAVAKGDHAEASRHLMPSFMENGEFTANRRAGAMLMTAYWSEAGLSEVVSRPDEVLGVAQQGRSPILWLDAKAKNAPPSPYVSLAQTLQARSQERSQQATHPSPEPFRRLRRG